MRDLCYIHNQFVLNDTFKHQDGKTDRVNKLDSHLLQMKNVGLMLAHRLQLWPILSQHLGKDTCFLGKRQQSGKSV